MFFPGSVIFSVLICTITSSKRLCCKNLYGSNRQRGGVLKSVRLLLQRDGR
jgi:hypothetical protein